MEDKNNLRKDCLWFTYVYVHPDYPPYPACTGIKGLTCSIIPICPCNETCSEYANKEDVQLVLNKFASGLIKNNIIKEDKNGG